MSLGNCPQSLIREYYISRHALFSSREAAPFPQGVEESKVPTLLQLVECSSCRIEQFQVGGARLVLQGVFKRTLFSERPNQAEVPVGEVLCPVQSIAPNRLQ